MQLNFKIRDRDHEKDRSKDTTAEHYVYLTLFSKIIMEISKNKFKIS